MLNLILVLNRLTLGMMFALAGLHKVFQVGMGDFYKFFESIKPEGVPMVFGYLLPFVEIVAGLALVAGFFARTASTLIVLMLLSFIIGMGISFWPQKGPPFDSNVILFTLALWLTLAGPGAWSADAAIRRRRELARSEVRVPPIARGGSLADDRAVPTSPHATPPPPTPPSLAPDVESSAPIDPPASDEPSDRN